jgi:predicted amidohydrolase YtcJ
MCQERFAERAGIPVDFFSASSSAESTRHHSKRSSRSEERIDIHNALKSYTVWAAHQMFLDDRIGSLEVGRDADIAIWDRNPYQVDVRLRR